MSCKKSAGKNISKKNEARYIDHLFGPTLEDPFVRNRLIELLQLQPFERRMILNNWIEIYWLKNTGPEIIQALACLYDDKLAAETLKLISR
jgi:hypothetical protein